jgi:hypothetical protein
MASVKMTTVKTCAKRSFDDPGRNIDAMSMSPDLSSNPDGPGASSFHVLCERVGRVAPQASLLRHASRRDRTCPERSRRMSPSAQPSKARQSKPSMHCHPELCGWHRLCGDGRPRRSWPSGSSAAGFEGRDSGTPPWRSSVITPTHVRADASSAHPSEARRRTAAETIPTLSSRAKSRDLAFLATPTHEGADASSAQPSKLGKEPQPKPSPHCHPERSRGTLRFLPPQLTKGRTPRPPTQAKLGKSNPGISSILNFPI